MTTIPMMTFDPLSDRMRTKNLQSHVPPAANDSNPIVHHWQAIVVDRWYQLGKEVLATTPHRSLRLREIIRECELLAVVVAWFMNDGNITHTAANLRSNRRSVRERITRWRERYPHLAPPKPLPTATRSKRDADRGGSP